MGTLIAESTLSSFEGEVVSTSRAVVGAGVIARFCRGFGTGSADVASRASRIAMKAEMDVTYLVGTLFSSASAYAIGLANV